MRKSLAAYHIKGRFPSHLQKNRFAWRGGAALVAESCPRTRQAARETNTSYDVLRLHYSHPLSILDNTWNTSSPLMLFHILFGSCHGEQ